MSVLVKRAEITNKTMDRFKGKGFEWRVCDCVKMTRTHLVAFGHPMPHLPRYNSAISALRALRAKGWDDVTAMLDEFLPRIAPATMLIGDVAIMESDENDILDAIVICIGQYVIGFHQDSGEAVVILPNAIKLAWGVL